MIFGVNGLLGSRLPQEFEKFGFQVFGTSRKEDADYYFDLEDLKLDHIPEVDVAVVPIGITNYSLCDTPSAEYVNVTLLRNLAYELRRKNIFSVFISSNSVFGGKSWPKENDTHSPTMSYAQQKSWAELAPWSCIIRLTKIVTSNTPPLPNWFNSWEQGETVEAFTDFIFSPISVQYAARNITKITSYGSFGGFHLSGSKNLSYFDFATLIDAGEVKPSTSTEKGVSILFKPEFSALDMKETTKLIGIQPQHPEEVVDDL